MKRKFYYALKYAIKSGSIEFVRELLKEGADANACPDLCAKCSPLPCDRCDTALMAAVRRQNIDMVRLLMAYGADPSVEVTDSEEAHRRRTGAGPGFYKTALYLAVFTYNKEMVTELVKLGANINQPLYGIGSYLHIACGPFRPPHDRNMVEHLLRLGADATVIDYWNSTATGLTVSKCHGNGTRRICDAFDDLRALLPLTVALDVELLLGRRQRTAALFGRGIDTPINNETVALFLQHGARINYCQMYLTGSPQCALELRTNGEQHSERFIELLRAADTDFSGARKRIASVDKDEWAPLNLAVLDRKLSQPLTLQALCVISVRRQLHSVSDCGLWAKIDELALPRLLSDLLKLKMS